MNNINVSLHSSCSKFKNLHNYIQNDIDIFKQNYIYSTHFYIIYRMM